MLWSESRSMIRRVIQDDTLGIDGEYSMPDEDLLAYMNFALDWVSNRHPVRMRTTLDVDSSRVITRPSGALRIVSVFGDGKLLDEVYDDLYPTPGSWSLVSENEIKIGKIVGTTCQIMYDSSYSHISADDDELPVDNSLAEICFCYATSRSLSARAVSSGNIDQYNTRTDSGNPEDNPLLRLAEHYEEMAVRLSSQRTLK